MKLILMIVLLCSYAYAQKNDLIHRPKSFNASIGKAVFVDFLKADYTITYDHGQKKSEVVAKIVFDAPEAGFPVFDSTATPKSIELNGESISSIYTQTPNLETSLRVMNKTVSVGTHVAVITVPLKELVDFNRKGVKSAFWTSDLTERQFLEAYMPANLEYDQVKMTFRVEFKGAPGKQIIYTNGAVKELSAGTNAVYEITYPEYFTASSIFFHTVPEESVRELRFSLKSLDGREVPAVVYVQNSIFNVFKSLETLKERATEVFHELEGDYGAWPHQSLIIYNAGQGGMEYCGATITSLSALGHELFHSYFARGVMPANGNSGWIDEALASWRDEGYKTSSSMSGSSSMSSHYYYTRTTDDRAYTYGENFMRYLNGKVGSKGGLKPFMRHMVENRKFAPLFVEEFMKEISAFYEVPLEKEFKKFTFSKEEQRAPVREDSVHRKMTIQELKEFL